MSEAYKIYMFIINPNEGGWGHVSTRLDPNRGVKVSGLKAPGLLWPGNTAFVLTGQGYLGKKPGLWIGTPHRARSDTNTFSNAHFLPDKGLPFAFAANFKEGLVAVVRRI